MGAISWVVGGWEIANSDHIEGVLHRCVSSVFLCDALEGRDTHDALAITRQTSIGAPIIAGSSKEVTISPNYGEVSKCFLSDDAGQCRRARLILSLRNPHILLLNCNAHQVNLIVGHIFESSKYTEWISKAVTSASKIKKSSNKWYTR